MSKIDLSGLSSEELDALISEASTMKRAARENERKALHAKFVEFAKAKGFTVEEVVGMSAKKGGVKKPRAKVASKYRNPGNAEQTWTGRGRAPSWAQPFKDNGKLDEILIS